MSKIRIDLFWYEVWDKLYSYSYISCYSFIKPHWYLLLYFGFGIKILEKYGVKHSLLVDPVACSALFSTFLWTGCELGKWAWGASCWYLDLLRHHLLPDIINIRGTYFGRNRFSLKMFCHFNSKWCYCMPFHHPYQLRHMLFLVTGV